MNEAANSADPRVDLTRVEDVGEPPCLVTLTCRLLYTHDFLYFCFTAAFLLYCKPCVKQIRVTMSEKVTLLKQGHPVPFPDIF